MSDAEDDYLSDKFLAAAVAVAPSKPITYAERRKQAQREAELKNAQNRKKTKREIEEETRREGLTTSLFEKAIEQEQAGSTNKAMAMMLKMGFKPGQTLGRVEEPAPKPDTDTADQSNGPSSSSRKLAGHLVEPIAIDVWSGRQGLGKRKRPVSPKAAAKLAKIVQTAADDDAKGSFRERARQEYEERRDHGRLVSATRTCVSLDEKAGKDFNVFWLNPQDPETFPSDLLEALTTDGNTSEPLGVDEPERLRQQMKADALQPLNTLEDEDTPTVTKADAWPPEVVEEARKFISANASKRLEMVLKYLRANYFYCFWCGTQYNDPEDLQSSCPGLTEEDHD